jgi:CBS domain-containing protein
MLVRDIMASDPVTLSPETTLHDALGTLSGRHVTAAPVVDAAGVLVGILSEADVLEGRLEPDPRAQQLHPVTPVVTHVSPTVADLMRTGVVTAHPDDDLAETIARLVHERHKSLPVVDLAGRVVGVLSRSEVVRLLARSDAEISSAVADLLAGTVGGDWRVDVRDGVVHLTGSDATLSDAVAAYLLTGTVPGVLGVDEVRGASSGGTVGPGDRPG